MSTITYVSFATHLVCCRCSKTTHMACCEKSLDFWQQVHQQRTCVRYESLLQHILHVAKCQISCSVSLTQLEKLCLDSNYIWWDIQGGSRSSASLDELKCLPHLTMLEIKIPNTNVLSKGLFSKKLEKYNINIG